MMRQLAVTFHNDETRYFTIGFDKPWSLRTIYGAPTLVIGVGVPRTHIPLMNVQSFELTISGDDK